MAGRHRVENIGRHRADNRADIGRRLNSSGEKNRMGLRERQAYKREKLSTVGGDREAAKRLRDAGERNDGGESFLALLQQERENLSKRLDALKPVTERTGAQKIKDAVKHPYNLENRHKEILAKNESRSLGRERKEIRGEHREFLHSTNRPIGERLVDYLRSPRLADRAERVETRLADRAERVKKRDNLLNAINRANGEGLTQLRPSKKFGAERRVEDLIKSALKTVGEEAALVGSVAESAAREAGDTAKEVQE